MSLEKYSVNIVSIHQYKSFKSFYIKKSVKENIVHKHALYIAGSRFSNHFNGEFGGITDTITLDERCKDVTSVAFYIGREIILSILPFLISLPLISAFQATILNFEQQEFVIDDNSNSADNADK